MRCLSATAVLVIAMLAVAQPASPSPAEIRALVKQLGSEDFAEREAANKRLDAIGGPALAELRSAVRSDNPEVIRRARDLLRKIEHRIENEKTLAPTLVALDAKDERLDDVLAGLSRQAKCQVVLNGAGLEELADRRVSVSTKGEVPFWDAVLRVCNAAGLEIAGAGGFSTPGALPFRPGTASTRIRTTPDINRSVVLEPRGTSPRRPFAINGAILIEALPLPEDARSSSPCVLLQAWPEPRLAWGTASGVRVGSAVDGSGKHLAVETIALAPPKVRPNGREGLAMVRKRDGGVAFVPDGSASRGSTLGFKPNARQAVVSFKAAEKAPTAVKELGVALLGTVLSGIEPLSRATGLEVDRQTTGSGVDGVDLSVSYYKNLDGRLGASVTVVYDRVTVQPVGVGDELPGTKGGGPGKGNQSVHGVRITDADGKPYTLGVISGASRPEQNGRLVMALTLELHPDKDGHGPPAIATFWGTYAKPVEVPVVLKDVPLSVVK